MVQITEVNREPATTVSTLTATTEVTSPSVTADSASVTNAVDAGSVTTDTLEATGSITDPEGNTVTSLSDPVRVTEEASTFTESNVTTTNNNTQVSNGSIELSGSQTSGDALISFDSGVPADINSWDLATFQRTLDNETVTVDLVTFTQKYFTFYGFENGSINDDTNDWSDWNTDTSNFEAQTSTVISGDYSARLFTDSSDYNAQVSTTRSNPITTDFKYKIRISSDTGNTDDATRLFLQNSSTGKNIGNLYFNDGGGNVDFNGNEVLASWNPDTTYTVEFKFDFDSDNIDILIDGDNKGTFSLSQSADAWDYIQYNNNAFSSSTARDVFLDELATKSDAVDEVLKSDISKNADISNISNSKSVIFRTNLSRNDTSNNPTVDYLARRFTR